MSISSVSSSTVSGYQTTASSSTVANPNSELDKDAFLQMFITKLKYQDPLNTEDSDITGDLASYSSLESINNLGDKIDAMSEKLDSLNENYLSSMLMDNTSQAVSMVGKTVGIEIKDDSGNVTATDSGTVSLIKFVDGVPKAVVNGVQYDLSAITEVYS